MGDGDDSVMDEIGDDNYLLATARQHYGWFWERLYRGGAGNDSLTDVVAATPIITTGDGSDFITDLHDDSEVDIFHFGSG
jgi:hypothetical protein